MRGNEIRIGSIKLGLGAGAVLSPTVALAHGPPDWVFWPTAAWFAFALFAVFAGTGTFAANALSKRTSATARAARTAFYLVSGISGCGFVLAIVLAAQGPWSRPIAVLVALLTGFLAVVALVARPGGRAP